MENSGKFIFHHSSSLVKRRLFAESRSSIALTAWMRLAPLPVYASWTISFAFLSKKRRWPTLRWSLDLLADWFEKPVGALEPEGFENPRRGPPNLLRPPERLCMFSITKLV